MGSEKIGNHASGAGHRQTRENDPIGRGNHAAVQTNVAAPSLAPAWKRELVHVRAKITHSVKARGRCVRDDGVIRIVETGPGGRLGGELKPGSAQPEVVALPGAANAVHAVRHSLQPSVGSQAGQRGMTNARLPRLAPRNQPPLVLRNLGKSLYWTHITAKYTGNGILCSRFGR